MLWSVKKTFCGIPTLHKCTVKKDSIFFSTDLVLGKIVVRERNDDLSLLLAITIRIPFPYIICIVRAEQDRTEKNKDLFSKTINNKWPWISKHNQL